MIHYSQKRFYVLVFLCFFSFLFSVQIASAQVIINEIAWMGTQNSANDEWIELYNSGSGSVDLNGWLIEAADGTPSISLSGSVSAGGYFLLERTDDTSVPSVPADLIYTGALGNGGETLSLKDSSGLEVHKVDAGSGWTAGDNNTKETMQWDGGAWITAPATPKAVNSGVGGGGDGGNGGGGGSPPPEDDQQEEQETEPQMIAQIVASSIAVAGVATEFEGIVLGYSGETLTSGKYFWNFGDLTTREDKKSQKFKHTYFYPGDYVIILDYYRNYYAREPDATDRKSIKVIPAEVSISSVEMEAVSVEGGQGILIELSNDSTYEMDLSKWTLRSDSKIFSIPQNTIILAGKKLVLSSRITGLTEVDKNNLRLLYPGGEIAFVYTEPESETASEEEDINAIESSLDEEQSTAEQEPEPIAYTPEQAKTFAVSTKTQKHVSTKTEIDTNEDTGMAVVVSVPEDTEATTESLLSSVAASQLAGAGAALPAQSEGSDAGIYKWLTALFALVIVALSAVFILRKKIAPEPIKSEEKELASREAEEIEILD